MKRPPRIEHELGVPIPGPILDESQWTKTALKKLPPPGPLDKMGIFGREANWIVDLGCGNGRFLLGSALARPECDHLGIDILPMVIRYATRRGNQRGLSNLRFAVIDAERLLEQYLAPGSVTELHLYHPQPYYEPEKYQKRVLTPLFMSLAHRALEENGKFFIQTDHPAYWSYVKEVLPSFFRLHELTGRWPDAVQGRTRREIVAMKRKLPIFRGWGERIDALTIEQAASLARTLPPPTFESDRRLRYLDSLEQGDN